MPMHARCQCMLRCLYMLQDCEERRGLASFEVPFAYQEAGAFIIRLL